jgi:hypothetical protein
MSLRLRGAERAARGRRRGDLREPAQRRRREASASSTRRSPRPPAPLHRLRDADSTPPRRSSISACGRRASCWRCSRPGASRSTPGTRGSPISRPSRRYRAGAGALPPRARLRDRRRGDQGGAAGPSRGAGRGGRAGAALGDRLQVRADAGHHGPPLHRDQRGADREPEPVRRAGAGGDRRGHGAARHAPQRGGHPPQGHPAGRPGGGEACRRGDPAGRGPGARGGSERSEPFRMPDACPVCGTPAERPRTR